ncbi:hypothetical protein QOZ80_9BG0702330 [Eleusine coracana subsp. coracana]|nr:hypothetical protein QOZ80_9BG0702330 [Eleusine coracana subsp. coracana]
MLSSAVSRLDTMPETGAIAIKCSSFPESVLLDTMGCIGPCDNATTKATACITGADAAVLLLRLDFPDPHGICRMASNVFIYKVAPETQLLYFLLRPYPVGLHRNHVAVLSCDDDVLGNYCLIVVPERRFDDDGQMWYDLQTFSTMTKMWSTRVIAASGDLDRHCSVLLYPTKVFSTGGGLMTWVDWWYGILLCDLLDEEADIRWMELVPLTTRNKVKFALNSLGELPPLDKNHDVTFRDGCFMFIEIEQTESDQQS